MVISVEGCYDVGRTAEAGEVGEGAGMGQETPFVADRSLGAGRDIHVVRAEAEAKGTMDGHTARAWVPMHTRKEYDQVQALSRVPDQHQPMPRR